MTITTDRPTRPAGRTRTRKTNRPRPLAMSPGQAEIQVEVATENPDGTLRWTAVAGKTAWVGIADQTTADFLPVSPPAAAAIAAAIGRPGHDEAAVAWYRVSAAVTNESGQAFTSYMTFTPSLGR